MISVVLRQGETIEKVYLVYRPFGSSDYERLEMNIVGNTATTSIPTQNVLPPFLEYYIVLQNRSGDLESYPLSENRNPFETPPEKTIQIPVHADAESDTQIAFLSPEPGARVTPDELLISISLLRADTIVVKRATQVLLDGADISGSAVISSDLVVVSPENAGITVRPGTHRLTVRLFNRTGTLHSSASIAFTVLGTDATPPDQREEGWRYNTSLQFESRNENIGSLDTWYNRGAMTFTGRVDDWRFNANAFITSDEKSDRQQQDRYFASAELPWVRVGYGDAYPSFPTLILSGKRVRGLTSALKLGWFNVDLTLGKTTRAVEGTLVGTFAADSFAVEYRKDSLAGQIPPYGKLDAQTWGKFRYGTFARDLFAIRPSFGSGEGWQWGFTWLKSKDDVGSIQYGSRPQENLVIGTDFIVRLDENRIEASGQGAFSVFNSDISSGTFTDADIDSIFHDESKRKEARDVRDVLKRFITVNENLRPLSFNSFPTTAYEASLALNYFDNVLKFTYLFRGSDYNSFGQTFLRKDIKGINITERMRLAENRVLASASAEFLKDNTAHAKIATTSFTNLNFALSYYPDADFPNITAGFARYASNNYLAPAGTDSMSAIDDATNRFFIQSSYEFDLSAHHTATLSLSTSKRNDRSVRKYDVDNVTLALGLNTKYSIPLQTSIDISINTNTLPRIATQDSSGRFNYSTLTFNARYSIVQDVLSVTAATSPTFGDFKRTVWDAGLSWTALRMMLLEFQFGLYNNQGGTNDTIWSLRCRYDV